MPIRKNKKRIDPRYFLSETTHRDLNEEALAPHLVGQGAQGKPTSSLQHYNLGDIDLADMIRGWHSEVRDGTGLSGGKVTDLTQQYLQKNPDRKAVYDTLLQVLQTYDKAMEAQRNGQDISQFEKALLPMIPKLKNSGIGTKRKADPTMKKGYDARDARVRKQQSDADAAKQPRFEESMKENLGGGADMAKAEELAATFQKSPTIMAAVEQAMRDPEVQKALEQATAGGLQEEEDPYADDPVGAAYQKKAQLAGAGEVASAGVGAVGAGAVVGPAILTTIAGKMVVTGAIAALGIAGGAALMGLAIVAALAFQSRRTDASQKAKGYVNRDARDFGREEWEKLHSGE